jgi:hypothetical protein
MAVRLMIAVLLAGAGCEQAAPPESTATSAAPTGEAASTPIFADRTEASGLDCVHDPGASGEFYFPEIMAPGGALFDYDSDGDLDVYCVQSGPVVVAPGENPRPSDRLLRNDVAPDEDGIPRARFRDVSTEAGIDARGYGMGVAAGDYDGDGHTDLYVTNFGPNQLWRNRGDGRFEEVTARAGVDDPRWSTSAAFLDFDRDGHLDLFVTSYVDFRVAANRPCSAGTGRPDYCAPSAYRGEPDRLFHNRGDGVFEDVSGAAGILSRYGNGLGVVSADFDDDGWIDLFVANDQQPNFLWRNRGDGTFEEVALMAGAAVNTEGRAESSMGVDAADVDNDGDEDLFMTHLGGETNTLYLNLGDLLFEDRTFAARLGMVSLPFTGFGTAFLDFDNDGWLDVFSANGAVHTLEAEALGVDAFPFAETDQLWRNLGDGSFEDVSGRAGPAFRIAAVGRGVAVGDVDNDGDSDLVRFDSNGPARLLDNQVGSGRGWVGVRLVTGTPPRDALGARVVVTLPGGALRSRRARADASYLSANDPRILLGIGDARRIEGIEVRWPDGRVERRDLAEVGAYSTIVQGPGEAEGRSQ